jgi:ribose transport system permease protein
MAGRKSMVTADPAIADDASVTPRRDYINLDLFPAIVVLACAILLMIATKALNPESSVVQQISAILVTSIFLVVASFGQGLTILLGGIDLSIGVVIGLSAMMISVLTNGSNGALPWAIPITLASCAIIGLVNGIGIALGNVPPFIMTLASGITFFGVGLGFTSGLAQEPVAPALQSLMSGHWLGVPIPIFLILAFLILASIFQNGTSEGRKLYAIGSSPDASRVLGLPIAGLTVAAYTISGLCASISGLLLAGYSSAATLDMQPTATANHCRGSDRWCPCYRRARTLSWHVCRCTVPERARNHHHGAQPVARASQHHRGRHYCFCAAAAKQAVRHALVLRGNTEEVGS